MASADPIEQFAHWFDEALRSEVDDPNAMTLATARPDGRPSLRIVLLKGFDERGFVFFTNYQSRKGREMEDNPHVAICFWWSKLARQVQIEGAVTRVSPEESDAYFASRPLDSRLGAWASDQSSVIASREVLDRRLQEMRTNYADGEIPRPPHWGGYRLVPHEIEFWQGRPNRLHDRLRYCLVEGFWTMHRLAP